MAWQTHGASNLEDMCDQLQALGVIRQQHVLDACRTVDRRNFLPEQCQSEAYTDTPIRYRNFHQSAPHMYGAALEALDLQPGLSFLNIGSGTGYLSTVAALICGPTSVHHGLEIHKELVEHAQACYTRYAGKNLPGSTAGGAAIVSSTPPKSSTDMDVAAAPTHGASRALGAKAAKAAKADKTVGDGEPTGMERFANVTFVQGNVFDLDFDHCMAYDRIYVGAACPLAKKTQLCKLLATGGVLVGPFEDEFIRVRCIGEGQYSETCLSGVRFAPLLTQPHVACVLPKPVWSPLMHLTYPDSFRASTKALLLCSKRPHTAAGMLPKSLWMEVLRFCSRTWFVPELPLLERLTKRLENESKAREEAESQLRDAKRACREAERQRDVYKVVARRLHMQIQEVLERERAAIAALQASTAGQAAPNDPPAAHNGSAPPQNGNVPQGMLGAINPAAMVLAGMLLGSSNSDHDNSDNTDSEDELPNPLALNVAVASDLENI